MWRLSSAVFSLLLSTSSVAVWGAENLDLSVQLLEFNSWAELHGKEYESNDAKLDRLQIWLYNNERIQNHNSQEPPPTFQLGHNAFSDMTTEEFVAYFKLRKDYSAEAMEKKMNDQADDYTTSMRRSLLEVDPVALPDYVNWVEFGAVTPVKNQGACGSCWAFATTGALEGAKFVKTGELVALSEQNLIDCDHKDLGCSGGLMDNAFQFDEKNGGLCSEEDYPYIAKVNPTCRTDCVDVPGSIVQSFVDVPPGHEKALLSALAMQPIAVAIQADQFVFQFYKSGVITDEQCGSSGDINHGVLAVGYGTDLDTQEPYFLVKNSWGETWGDKGYVKIGRRTKNEFGLCSILKLASFPIVE